MVQFRGDARTAKGAGAGAKFRFPGPFVRLMTEHVYADSIAGETDSVEFHLLNCHYWLDLGNNADSGQFVLGQPENQRNKGRDLRLPTAPRTLLNSSSQKLDKKDKLPPCSALEALERQEPFVNQTLAYQALQCLRGYSDMGGFRTTARS